jgi:hypothetical protein
MNYISSYLLHAGINQFPKIEVWILLFDIMVELFVVDFISFLIFAIVWQILLDSVVSKMNTSVTYFEGVFSRSGPHIPFTVPVTFHSAMRTV